MTAFVWGITADLTNRESRRIKARWPVVCCDAGIFRVTEGEEWDCGTGHQLSKHTSEDHLLTFATRLQSNEPIYIQPGQLLAIAGADLVVALTQLKLKPEIKTWTSIQNGFRVHACAPSEYESLVVDLADSAADAFDEAVLSQNLRGTGGLVESALLALRATAKRPERQSLRWLFYQKELRRDFDTWRTSAELEAVSQGVSAEKIAKDVADYHYSLIERLADRGALTVVISEGPPRLYLERLQAMLRATPIGSTGAIKEHFAAFLDGLARFGKGTNSAEFGEEFGRWLGNEQFEQRLLSPFHEIWKSLMHAVEEHSSSDGKTFLAETLRGFAQRKAECEHWRFGDNSCEHLPDDVRDYLFAYASRVVDAMDDANLGTLTLGVSEYPEDQFLADLVSGAIDLTGKKKRLLPNRIRYGTLKILNRAEQADIACVNEVVLKSEHLKSAPVFEHLGYYAFVRRDFIESAERAWPTEAWRSIERIMQGVQVLDDPDSANLDLSVRCGLAVKAGLTRYLDSEYGDLTHKIEIKARKVSHVTYPDGLPRSKSITADFEEFVRGERQIFMGGSIHARLLMNWWLKYSTTFLVLLRPVDFSELLADEWPLHNRIWFGNSLNEKGPLRQSIYSLYLRAADELFRPFTNGSKRMMRHFAGDLARRARRDPESYWNFVVDPEELGALLNQDNRPVSQDTEDATPYDDPKLGQRRPARQRKERRRS